MNYNRVLMGAAIVGCLTTAMTPGVYAQESNTRSNAQSNAHARSQMAGHASADERRVGTPVRQGRGYAEQGTMRGERRTYVRPGIDGYHGERMGYRDFSYGDPTVDLSFGTTGGGYAYPARRVYAYTPTYAPGYVTEPGYSYAPAYDVSVNAAPYYAPAWNVTNSPYDDYGPGVGVGIGIGPIGIGIGPGWEW
jgi:hypothetical protein